MRKTMNDTHPASPQRAIVTRLSAATILIAFFASVAVTHPLGNFTVNHFTRIEAGAERVRVYYVVDMAEIPAFQELQSADGDEDGHASSAELNAYLERVAAQYAGGLLLTAGGERVLLKPVKKTVMLPPGAGGLATLRVECVYEGGITAHRVGTARQLHFEDTNHRDRIGWREIVVVPASGIAIFNSTAFSNGATDEIKAYPADMLAAPLNERSADLSFTQGEVPAGAASPRTRDGRAVVQSRDRFAELIAVPEVTPLVALLGLISAAALGALHALSPGHGKTVVGAYLAGSRGTARHAVFLGLTVTITHTAGIFALGLVTLFASQYIVPERLFPILSFASGAIVLAIGLSLFRRRLRDALGHTHDHSAHSHERSGDASPGHSHGGRPHSHLPPGTDGSPITWRSLVALGVSGGLLPCPSALVVLLSAISLNRAGYGLLLVVAFSIGLAATLTGIGLAFVYGGRLVKRSAAVSNHGLVRVLPAASALVIACAGAAICYEALEGAGWNLRGALNWLLLFAHPPPPPSALSTTWVLAFGFAFGLKHAIEADHLAAVSTIVSERKSVFSSALVGGLWGVGHTISLVVAGVAVILLHVQIGERTALFLEFCVAVMLLALGVNALSKLARGGTLHLHWHQHGGHTHAHPHLHEGSPETKPRTHHGFRLGARPLVVGMIHGLAGSAALMLLVLSTISSPLVGLAYIAVFGLGSIGGMMIMSALVGLPIQLAQARLARANGVMRTLAGLFSLCLGVYMVYQTGFVNGLFR